MNHNVCENVQTQVLRINRAVKPDEHKTALAD